MHDDEPPTGWPSRSLKRNGGIPKSQREPIDTLLVMTGQKKWWKSKSAVGLVASLALLILGLFGFHTEMPVELIIANVSGIFTNLIALWGTFKRTEKIEPIFKAVPIEDDENENEIDD